MTINRNGAEPERRLMGFSMPAIIAYAVQLILIVWTVATTYSSLVARVETVEKAAISIRELRSELSVLATKEQLSSVEQRLQQLEQHLLNQR